MFCSAYTHSFAVHVYIHILQGMTEEELQREFKDLGLTERMNVLNALIATVCPHPTYIHLFAIAQHNHLLTPPTEACQFDAGFWSDCI